MVKTYQYQLILGSLKKKKVEQLKKSDYEDDTKSIHDLPFGGKDDYMPF